MKLRYKGEQPAMPWSSLEHCRRGQFGYHARTQPRKEDKTFWPCLECQGVGTVWNPSTPPCPIEGNKMRSRISCPRCGGSGRGSKVHIKKVYDAAKERYKAAKTRYDNRIKLLKELEEKLTPEEIDVLVHYCRIP